MDHNKTSDHTSTDVKAIEASPVLLDQPVTPTRRNISTSQQPASNRSIWGADTLNVRVMLEHTYPQSPSGRRYSSPPLNHQEPTRLRSIRRRRSRSELKQYGAQQALQEMAREVTRENQREEQSRLSRANESPETKMPENGLNGKP
jgi:hypothetical protein